VIIALAGGVGGAKLASGLAAELPPDKLLVVVNTGDDFVHLGLHISPDLDTVMYTLAGRNNTELGWGLAGETWNFMAARETLGGATWFRLGDGDLATHVERTARLAAGETLSAVTRMLRQRFGIAHEIVPMTETAVRTIVHTSEGPLEFQHYFVRLRCEPRFTGISFQGAEDAVPSSAFDLALSRADLDAIVVSPSNPILSIQPILTLHGVSQRIRRTPAPVIAVSPIIAGEALKGPAAKIFRESGREASALEVARFYGDLLDGFVLDERDRDLKAAVEALGLAVCVTDTVMRNPADQARLARNVLDFAQGLRSSRRQVS
jgi:LPPG:FO 2-phospho-L-lactate transferase